MVSQFVRVCSENELKEDEARVFIINENPVIVVRHGNDVYALDGICTHDGGEFGDGEKIINGLIECPRHGARFDIKTGEAKRLPAVMGIGKHEVKIEDGDVFIEVED
jgi:3-phenylpropionate/trans-cinnamate dioxygenase ferredoxin subunit